MPRVAVTGIGVLSALGHSKDEFWTGLAAGRCGIGPIEQVDRTRLKFAHGAEVRRFEPGDHFDPRAADMLDRSTQFAVVTAREAMADARLPPTPLNTSRAGVVTGSSAGGRASEERAYQDLYQDGRGRVHPLTILRTMANAGASAVSMEFGLTGPVFTISTACASATHAIGQAFHLVRHGALDLAIAGGHEAFFTLGFLRAWEAMRVVAPDTCRPFSRDRKGLILGEGAAMLVLEPLAAARRRGARVYAEIVGFGMTSDAHHLTHPDADGPAAALRGALDDAAMAPTEVAYINAHGTGTAANDAVESRAIRAVFGAHADHLAVSSTKSMTGHALGAAGAIEAAATVLAMHHGVVPPTMNFTTPDPDCDLDVVPNQSRKQSIACALSNSFAFGGLNAVLAFRSV